MDLKEETCSTFYSWTGGRLAVTLFKSCMDSRNLKKNMSSIEISSADNVLFDARTHLLALTDFGLSLKLSSDWLYTFREGEQGWGNPNSKPPELSLLRDGMSIDCSRADLWSFAGLVWELFGTPFLHWRNSREIAWLLSLFCLSFFGEWKRRDVFFFFPFFFLFWSRERQIFLPSFIEASKLLSSWETFSPQKFKALGVPLMGSMETRPK